MLHLFFVDVLFCAFNERFAIFSSPSYASVESFVVPRMSGFVGFVGVVKRRPEYDDKWSVVASSCRSNEL